MDYEKRLSSIEYEWGGKLIWSAYTWSRNYLDYLLFGKTAARMPHRVLNEHEEAEPPARQVIIVRSFLFVW